MKKNALPIKLISCLLIALWLGAFFPARARAYDKEKTALKPEPFIYYKNETWKSRWKWNLLLTGVVFSGITLVFANSKTNYVKARSMVTLEKDKKALSAEIKNQESIINVAGALAGLSLGGSVYLFITDDAGVSSAWGKPKPCTPKIALGKNFTF